MGGGSTLRARLVRAAVAVAACLPLSGCFSAPPQLVQLNPANGSTGVPANAAIHVYFDRPVNHDSVASRFHLDPPLPNCDVQQAFRSPTGTPCWVEWSDAPAGFTFEHPGAPFAAATKYTFHIDAGFSDQNGVRNDLDHLWQITTRDAPTVNFTFPNDGATDVPVDEPLVVSFSTFMDGSSTAAAISLSPAVPESTVVQNTRDLSRFLFFAGQLLAPDSDYTLSVGPGATDRDGLAVAAPVTIRFHTASMNPSEHHLVVLARRPGEGPSAVYLTMLAPQQVGEPGYSVPVLASDTCAAERCGPLHLGASETEYTDAVLSPTGNRLAVVERDLLHPSLPPRLLVLALPSVTPRVVAAPGSLPSWSPDGARLCYAAPDGIHVLDLASNADTLLPAGPPLAAPAQWSPDGSTLALPLQPPNGPPTVQLADPALLVRTALPDAPGAVTDPRFSPDGTLLAVRRDGWGGSGGEAAGAWLYGVRNGRPPRPLAGDLTPLGWAAAGTLVAVERPSDGSGASLATIDTGTGDTTTIPGGPLASDLSTAVLAPGGRQVAFLLADPHGVVQAWTQNLDGTAQSPVTQFPPGSVEASAVAT